MRRKKWTMWLLCVLFVFAMGEMVSADESVDHTLWFFYNNVCASCHEDDNFYELFNRCVTQEEKKNISYETRTFNVFRDADMAVYEEALDSAGKEKEQYALPVLVIDETIWLSGYDAMEENLHAALFEGLDAAAQVGEADKGADAETYAEDVSSLAIDVSDEEQLVLLFTTYSCSACEQVKELLEKLQEQEAFRVIQYNVAEENYVGTFKALLEAYGRTQEEGQVPAAFVGDRVLLGEQEIEKELPGILAEGQAVAGSIKARISQMAVQEVEEFSFQALFGAGLLGGFNPCSISMLLMLFSILLTAHASVLKNGLLYLAGKYITYLGLGVLICFAASGIDQQFLSRYGRIVDTVIILLFLAAAVLNFLDFLNVRKDEYGKVRMQLPKKLRRFNHTLLKKAEHVEGIFLALLVLGLGIAVSLGEFFCTGQIYMASILYLLRNGNGLVLKNLLGLLLYVTAMSIPAAVILLIIDRTKGIGRVSDFMLNHLGAIKLLNTVLFLLYAMYFLFWQRI